ncbi:putative DNA-binding protein (MmcQ/YjbR family) [Dyadobacter jejuensis]|uniref:Putative DNA-binding protein (MmcQ/YjbR family) n=1 Tax=Dyadobacter jejuensis TaxID=1082580 RepID=A0A316B8P3_9BACT|nr:MmcQ/YjbR family DNA-binding protein [Dyadobacter jejuensis]PWJ58897.1 putative DNA-binding protein (MmcQ/YjbR family) [Dyadobacter jejuensis]
MNQELLRDYCLSFPGVTEELPFGPDILVFKVMGKMFLLTGLDEIDVSYNIKCDPELAVDLRAQYPAVQPGYHMNKKHWNTVHIDGSIPTDIQLRWVKDSYDLVVKSLTKALQQELNLLGKEGEN